MVHGDCRSHAIVSPPSVVAGSSHLCESLTIAIGTEYEEHGDLPDKASVQLDNASVNHSMLTLGYCALYVLFGVFKTFRVRFELVPRPVDCEVSSDCIVSNVALH